MIVVGNPTKRCSLILITIQIIELTVTVDTDNPWKQEGSYGAVISNLYGVNESVTYMEYDCKLRVHICFMFLRCILLS